MLDDLDSLTQTCSIASVYERAFCSPDVEFPLWETNACDARRDGNRDSTYIAHGHCISDASGFSSASASDNLKMKQRMNPLMAAAWMLIVLIIAAAQNGDRELPFTFGRPISQPTVFAPGVISTGDYEVCPEFSPDGKTLYFVKSTPDANFWTIVFSRLERGKWSAPRVAPFSGQYSDADEFITRDGQSMFFISKRPLPNATNKEPRKLDIWVMHRTATGWGEPRNLGAPVNSEESETFRL